MNRKNVPRLTDDYLFNLVPVVYVAVMIIKNNRA